MLLEPPKLFRHKYGGLYRLVATAKHSETLEELCIYVHLWPFTPGEAWARPAGEWEEKFTSITEEELRQATAGDRAVAQQAVNDAKAAARAAKKNDHEH